MKKAKQTITVPSNIDFASLVPKRTTYKVQVIDAMKVIVHTLLMKMQHPKGMDEIQRIGGSRLNSQILQETIGRTYKRALEYLEAGQVIEIVIEKGISIKRRTRIYSLKKALLGNLIKVEIITPIVNKYIENARRERKKRKGQRVKAYKGLETWLNNEKLGLQESTAQYFIEKFVKLLGDRAQKYLAENPMPGREEELSSRIGARYRNMNLYLEYLNGRREFETIVDDKGGRMYTIITGMPSAMRNFLQFGGEQLISIDLKSSQPYFFTAVMNKDIWKTSVGNTLYSINRNVYKSILKCIQPEDINIVLASLETQAHKGFQGKGFRETVIEDDIYLEVAKVLYPKLATKPDQLAQKRNAAKKKVMIFMFNDYSKKGLTPEYKAFKNRFPHEVALMEVIKTGQANNFPILLQALEAHVFLKRIAPRILAELPDTPFFTVHDSIITLVNKQQRVQQIMEEELFAFTGNKPVLKPELLDLDSAMAKLPDFVESDFKKIRNSIAHQLRKKARPLGVGTISSNELLKPAITNQIPTYQGNSIISTKYFESNPEKLFSSEDEEAIYQWSKARAEERGEPDYQEDEDYYSLDADSLFFDSEDDSSFV